MKIETSSQWHTAFPGGHVGVLLIGDVDNSKRETALDTRKKEIESGLREKFGGSSRAELLEHQILKSYRDYYKKFDKTYHVQLQLESVALKGKSLPNISPLVDANFAAELNTLVLTAGHDADLLQSPITIDASKGGENFVAMNGAQKPLKANDMMMTDSEGVVCTIIYGQDKRTPISQKTKRALYVAYAPTGVPLEAVEEQLNSIKDNVLMFAPEANVEMQEIFTGTGSE